ncbi:MAG: hypothetical protein GSR85_00590 [Desulfurococcales archaeon]|nr:hypothetical protein [Desulfurococcales archaeon]
MGVVEVLRDIARIAEGRGLEARVDEDRRVLTVSHPDVPVSAVFEPSDGEFRVVIRAGDELRERIDELLDEDVDPREVVEEALDTVIAVVDRGITMLERQGVRVRRDTRGGILDVYDAIESFVEEA